MLTILGYRIAATMARVLPAPLAEALAVALARLAFDCRVPARRALEENLARLLPRTAAAARRRHARGAFETFGRSFADFLRGRPRATDVRVVGERHLAGALASGRGVIVLSAHLGNWEGGAAAMAAQGCPLHLAARPQAHAPLEALFASRRAAAGVRALPAGALMPAASCVLRRGEWIALMADRGPARAGGASVCAWAAALAQRTGALVLPAVFVREPGGGHRLHVEAPIEAAACRDGAFRDTMLGWLARWPDQWAAFESLPEGLA
jgi:KDO2-lipid IV(A) lauroyltransferase